MPETATTHSSHWGSYGVRVEDGLVVEALPPSTDPDPSPLLRSVPGVVHARNRVRRPAVRASWLAGRPGRRGADPFVEIGWDEALDLVADVLRRTYVDEGPAAVFGGSYGWSSAGRLHHAKTQLNHFLACAGGYTGIVSNYSFGAADRILPHVLGDASAVTGEVATWEEIAEHTDVLLMLGGFPAKNVQLEPGGTGAHVSRLGLQAALDAGTRLINVNPVRGDAPDHPNVTWLPIRPGTDTALLLAVITSLVSGGQIDTAFLDRCAVGFDLLAAYLSGAVDGIEKNARWAETITGIPAHEIEQLAATLGGRDRPRTMITATWALQRADHGEQPYWSVIALASALGQIGLPGGGFGFGYGCVSGFGTATRPYGTPAFRARRNPVDSWIPVARLSDMLLHPGEAYEFDGTIRSYPKISTVYWAGGNPFHHHQDLNRLVEAWQRPQTVIVHEPWWTPTARMADIVLPATTTLERDDIGASSKDAYVVAMKRAIDPQAEARNDRTIFAHLAERLGVAEDCTAGQSDAEALRSMYDRARASAGTRDRVMPDFDSFWAAGHFRHEPEPSTPPFAAFRADPRRHPLQTPSGKIEIFSAVVDSFGYPECPGHPSWLEPAERLGSSDGSPHALHLLSPQPATRLHSQLDMGVVSRTAKVAAREPCTMNSYDAARRGICDGDVVRIWTDRGELYAGAFLSDDVIEGVALLSTGAWYTPEDPSQARSAELHGNVNVLTRDAGSSRLSQATSAQTLMVQIERATGDVPWREPHDLPTILSR